MEFAWITLLIVSILAYAFLMAYVLPRAFLKTEIVAMKARDRGLKNIKETVGRSIVYQPSMEARKYVTQYVISDRKGKKVLICKTHPDVRYLDYDVVMFNAFNKPFKAVNARELVENGRTEKLELDKETAYVSLIINAANDEKFKRKLIKPVSGGKIALYALTCALLAFAQVYLMKLCCSYAFGGVFREEFMITLQSNMVTIFCGVAAAIINVALVLTISLKRNRAEKVKGEK